MYHKGSVSIIIIVFYSIGIYIVGAKRTVFGTFGGKLKDHNATDLASTATVAALNAAKVAPEQVDSVICGNVSSVSKNHVERRLVREMYGNCNC